MRGRAEIASFSVAGARGTPGSARQPPKAALKTKMLTQKVSTSFNPCYSQGDVHGRIRFDGFATAKTCV